MIANNTLTNLGSWINNSTNYSSGKKIGDELMLPAAGFRNVSNGTLSNRGYSSLYWSSTEDGAITVFGLGFYSSDSNTYNYNRTFGLSVRCIAE